MKVDSCKSDFLFLLFQVSSKSRKGLPQLSVGQSTLEDIMSRAYDSFDVKLTSLQFLYSKPGKCFLSSAGFLLASL